ncbi:MAG: PadR family transcriptional regulator [Chloroflexi bacterium]|jgi:DNA-binding PadR family transcriptional regulator|nr:PadR family transcriptional regulator [Chloroflexota bacterium]BCY16961.1 PadR family transcriptional regulator [Leptolinea sp. HRD-7]
MNDIGIETISLEMRRGVIVLAVLNLLQEEQYGYSVLRLLAENGLDVDQGTLYPLLRRLESQGLLESNWRVEEARPRRYYTISPLGRQVLPKLQKEWDAIVSAVQNISMIGR